jgi:predicted nucleic acid-binding Zn ribbon protein
VLLYPGQNPTAKPHLLTERRRKTTTTTSMLLLLLLLLLMAPGQILWP